jgi:hypothetical protein
LAVKERREGREGEEDEEEREGKETEEEASTRRQDKTAPRHNTLDIWGRYRY